MNGNTRQAIVVLLILFASIYIETPETSSGTAVWDRYKPREQGKDNVISPRRDHGFMREDSLFAR
jgi:hypothetical protein